MRRLLMALVLAMTATGAATACSSSAAKAGTCLSPLSTITSSTPASGAHALPRMSLGCLDGSGDVTIPALSKPMIVSFWAEYCAPCRTELPALATFGDAAAGKIAIVGVDTADVLSEGRSMAKGMNLTFPMLADPESTFFKAVAAPGLPTLLFVTPGGDIAYMSSSGDIDGAVLKQLTTKYLGVTVG
jgi:thiol-disulfide isomerase/thioredoxin